MKSIMPHILALIAALPLLAPGLIPPATAQARPLTPAVTKQEVLRTRWVMQDPLKGLQQELAQTVVERANDWMTRDNPNGVTARLDDRVVVETVTEYWPELGTFNTRLVKLILGTIVLEDSFENFLDAPTLGIIIRRDCFWRDETITVINPNISPLAPDVADLLSQPLSATATIQPAHGQTAGSVREWVLNDKALQTRLSASLRRYFAATRQDSGRVRYVISNTGRIPYRLRAGDIAEDSAQKMISVSLGRIIIASPASVRIALGDNLCAALLSTEAPMQAASVPLSNSQENFGHHDWSNGARFIVSLDRVDYHTGQTVGMFAGLGDPDANLRWWNDATARVGVCTPWWEACALLPFASGATAVGPLHTRLLKPVYGAAASGRLWGFQVSARLALPADATGSADPAMEFAHTWAGRVEYTGCAPIGAGDLYYSLGAGFEQYRNTALNSLTVNRVCPLASLIWVPPGQSVRLALGSADQALKLGLTARLGNTLWVELEAVSTDLLRARQPFEHSFSLFITPRLKF